MHPTGSNQVNGAETLPVAILGPEDVPKHWISEPLLAALHALGLRARRGSWADAEACPGREVEAEGPSEGARAGGREVLLLEGLDEQSLARIVIACDGMCSSPRVRRRSDLVWIVHCPPFTQCRSCAVPASMLEPIALEIGAAASGASAPRRHR
jgi:hypothetical protein